MGSRKYLPLTSEELRRVLKAFGFVRKRTRGDHEQWEGVTNEKRRVITVQLIDGEYAVDRMKTIIRNMDEIDPSRSGILVKSKLFCSSYSLLTPY